jgi:Tfp pilus assembly protein PilF
MHSLPVHRFAIPRVSAIPWLTLLLCSILPATIMAQSGRDQTGTGGTHLIQGKIYFPSGRRAEGSIQVKLSTYGTGEISTFADASGSFIFSSLSPGNYTITVNAGDEYEIARDNVTIDSDLNLSRMGIPMNSGTKRYTVMITLQIKPSTETRTKASVINAALAEVPDAARNLYQKALEFDRNSENQKAIENLKVALSLYPKFPLALNELGVQYLKTGQANKAVDPLKSAAGLSPDAFTPKLNLGIALLETQQYQEAEAQLREALKITSTPTAHMYLGLTLAHLRNDLEAEKEFKAAISSSNDQLSIAHYYLGGLYWQTRQYNRAAEELETYLRLAPNAPDAERVRGTIKELRAKS